MARGHARIASTIWEDADFLALTTDQQHLYLFLLGQPNLSHAGVLPLTYRRWARKASGLAARDLEDRMGALHTARFVVADEDTEEVLIRTFVRNDGVWKQPRMMGAMVAAAAEIESRALRAALLVEVLRIDLGQLSGEPTKAAGAGGLSIREQVAGHIADLHQLIDPTGGSATPSGGGSGSPSGGPSGGGSASPTGGGSAGRVEGGSEPPGRADLGTKQDRNSSGDPTNSGHHEGGSINGPLTSGNDTTEGGGEGDGEPHPDPLAEAPYARAGARLPLTPNPSPSPVKEGGRAREGKTGGQQPPARRRPDGLTTIDDADFQLTDAMRRWVLSTFGEGFDIDHATNQFVSHFRSTNQRRANWVEAWRKWVRDDHKRAAERSQRTGNRPGQTAGTDGRVSGWAEQARRFAAQDGHQATTRQLTAEQVDDLFATDNHGSEVP
ncbi:hypothetical protein [Streptomyces xiamenensis]|uniref:hypothetical protein n=1 Tax=Streptomyces xiamenensis TaxID=408015 RepID=UPI0037D333ED